MAKLTIQIELGNRKVEGSIGIDEDLLTAYRADARQDATQQAVARLFADLYREMFPPVRSLRGDRT